MQRAVDDLITLLDLEAIEVNIFRGTSPDVEAQRVFGGQVAGQALAGVVGPLIEVPVLVGLVYVSLWARPRLFAHDPGTRTSSAEEVTR
jgi:hypothetical protein